MTEFFLQGSNHRCSDLVFLLVSSNLDETGLAYTVELFEVVSLLCAGRSAGYWTDGIQSLPGISSDWGDVDHTISELDKSTSSEISTD
jgi:hypothetical protein